LKVAFLLSTNNFADADAAGIVLGARMPIILTSRSDSLRVRLASVAVAKLLVESKNATFKGLGN